MTAAALAVAAVAAIQALAILALLYERRDDRDERRELLNRLRPDTAQPHPQALVEPDPVPVHLEHDDEYNQHLEALEGR